MFRKFRMWGIALAFVGTASLIAACASDTSAPAAPEISGREVSAGPNHLAGGLPSLSLVSCTPLPYASSSSVVGAQGGVLQAGKHTLTIPAGALNRDVLITMEAPSDTITSVRFSPEGLTFNPSRKPRLEMDYSHCSLLSQSSKRIVYVDEQLNLLERLLSFDILRLFRIEAYLDHFSRYAVAY